MNKRENLYWLRFSVSAYGEDGISQLKAFREKLNAYNEKPLRQVYQDFDMVPTHVKKEDKVSAVGHIRVTTGDALYDFFFISTETLGMKHFSLWKNICKQYYPSVCLDVIGDSESGEHYCEVLLMPDSYRRRYKSSGKPEISAL